MVTTSPATMGEAVTKRPLTFTPLVEFWSETTQAGPSRFTTACRRETEKSFRTTPLSLDRPIVTSAPVKR